MAIIPVPSASEGPGAPAPAEQGGWVRATATSLDRFTPLIHELIAWDLIYRSDDGEYKLRDDIQRLLAERSLTTPTGPPEMFIGRKCQRCYRMTVTRMVDGSRVCSNCDPTGGPAAGTTESDTFVVQPVSRDRAHWRRKGHQAAS